MNKDNDSVTDAFDTCVKCGGWHYTHNAQQEQKPKDERHHFVRAIPPDINVPTDAERARASEWLSGYLGSFPRSESLAQLLAETRHAILNEVRAEFAIPFSWLCLDHGGEEQERILERIDAVSRRHGSET